MNSQISFSNLQPIVMQYPQIPLHNVSPLQIPQTIKIEIVKDVNSKFEWSTSICDCCLEPSICITGTFCPCILFGKNVENLTNKSCCLNACCCCILPCSVFLRTPYRRMIRKKYQLESDPCNDCCVSFWCPLCSLCQETREIRYNHEKPKQQFMV